MNDSLAFLFGGGYVLFVLLFVSLIVFVFNQVRQPDGKGFQKDEYAMILESRAVIQHGFTEPNWGVSNTLANFKIWFRG